MAIISTCLCVNILKEQNMFETELSFSNNDINRRLTMNRDRYPKAFVQ